MALYPEYQRLIDSGEYSSVEEMCNRLCLNYDDVYDYSDEEEDDQQKMNIIETIIGLVVYAVTNSGTSTGDKMKSGLETASTKAKEYNENLERKATSEAMKIVSERSTQELERKLNDPSLTSKGRKIIEDELKRR